jgi:hypothetical protein
MAVQAVSCLIYYGSCGGICNVLLCWVICVRGSQTLRLSADISAGGAAHAQYTSTSMQAWCTVRLSCSG